MNNPWLSLIAALSGERVNTPPTWPVREVHRLYEVRAVKSGAGSEPRQAHRHPGPLRSARRSIPAQ